MRTIPKAAIMRPCIAVRNLLYRSAMAALILGSMFSPLHAQEASRSGSVRPLLLKLTAGEAQVEAVAAPFDTVIVGDPAIVSTSVINATSLVLTARAAGRTNIILLDANGAIQTHWEILVSEENQHRAGIYRGTLRSIVSCNPTCRQIRELDGLNP